MGPLEGNRTNSRKFETVYTQQRRIAKIARQTRDSAILSLNQYLDLPWLEEAHASHAQEWRGRRGRADGRRIISRTARSKMQSLLDRAKSGTFFAPPVPPSTHLERTRQHGNSTVGYTDNTRTSHPLGKSSGGCWSTTRSLTRAHGAQPVMTRSQSIIGRAGCWKSACPDLWESRAGNRPGRPRPRGPLATVPAQHQKA